MKILTPIGSKDRLFEMFQGVNKSLLNEIATNVMQTGTQLVQKAFEELKNKQAQVKQTNIQTVNDENFVEIITVDETGKEITFTFKVNSSEDDQDGVYNVGDAVLTEFKIKSPTLNVEMPENMPAVQEFNQNHSSEIMDVVSQYADFETDTVSVDDEIYEEAVKFIDKIPYKKGSEEIQTHKAYADQKPTNPEVRVDADELQKFVQEMQDFVDAADNDDYSQSTIEDPMADPPEFSAADAAEILKDPDADDGTKGIDPYDQIDTDYDGEEASPEEQALFSQAYDNLVAAGNQAPNAVEIENEVNRLQGNQKPVEKTRAIPKGAEAFYESTDQDKYEDVVFMQGEEADEALEILNNQGEDAAMQYLMQWHSPGQHMGSAELGHGSSDQTYEKDGYIMAWNTPLNYIGLQYELSGLDEETERGDYPDQIGKKFKPKNQMPKKKKRPQSVVKLGEESEIPQEYWGSPEDEMNETEAEEVAVDDEPDDVIDGGKADDEHISKFSPQQIMIGMGVEMEHTDDPKIALEIAMDHLMEIPDYYTRLDKMEKEAGVTDEGMGDNTPEDEEMTDELLGYKPFNVNDYASEEFDYAAAERNYHDKEDMRQHPEDYEEPQDPDVGHAEYLKKSGQMKSFDDASGKEELIDEEDGFEEYAGDIGDRYQDGEGNQFTVRDKVKGGVTLQGQGGESEIATSDIKFLKKLSEEELVEIARQVLNKRGLNESMTKKEATQILIRHYIK